MSEIGKKPEGRASALPTPKLDMGQESPEHQHEALKKDRLKVVPDDPISGGISAGAEGEITAGPETQQSPGVLDSGTF